MSIVNSPAKGEARHKGRQLSIVGYAPFSVADFGFNLGANEDQYGTLELHCEECGQSYNRTHGKLEKSCRFCGGTKGITC